MTALWLNAIRAVCQRQGVSLEDELAKENRALHECLRTQAQQTRQLEAINQWLTRELHNRNETIAAMVEAIDRQLSWPDERTPSKTVLH